VVLEQQPNPTLRDGFAHAVAVVMAERGIAKDGSSIGTRPQRALRIARPASPVND
jgi:hypothetical protein